MSYPAPTSTASAAPPPHPHPHSHPPPCPPPPPAPPPRPILISDRVPPSSSIIHLLLLQVPRPHRPDEPPPAPRLAAADPGVVPEQAAAHAPGAKPTVAESIARDARHRDGGARGKSPRSGVDAPRRPLGELVVLVAGARVAGGESDDDSRGGAAGAATRGRPRAGARATRRPPPPRPPPPVSTPPRSSVPPPPLAQQARPAAPMLAPPSLAGALGLPHLARPRRGASPMPPRRQPRARLRRRRRPAEPAAAPRAAGRAGRRYSSLLATSALSPAAEPRPHTAPFADGVAWSPLPSSSAVSGFGLPCIVPPACHMSPSVSCAEQKSCRRA